MNIAVNTRLLIQNKLEGIGWFTYETLKRITQQHPEHHFIFFFDRPFSNEFIFSNNITPVIVHPPTRHPLLWYLWFEYAIPLALKKHKIDLFFSPDGWLSLGTKVKSMNVIHDLNFIHYPQYIPFHVRSYYNYFFPKFARKAHRIATVSEFSKIDISSQYNIDADKIDVVYNGANELYLPMSYEEQEKTRTKYSNGTPYFIFVGLIHPRKNLSLLFSAFDAFKNSISSNIKLIVVGEKKWWTKEISDSFEKMNFKNDVIFTGRLAPEQLKTLIASALAMTYVPYFEGFGIPILEAMYCDVPVITSNVSSMPEIAGGAALLVDPFSVDSIKEGMLKMAKDEPLRNSLIESGKKRRADFSWDKTASKLWNSIEKTVNK